MRIDVYNDLCCNTSIHNIAAVDVGMLTALGCLGSMGRKIKDAENR